MDNSQSEIHKLSPLILALEIRNQNDVVEVRQRTRQIARRFGFGPRDQTGFAVVVTKTIATLEQLASNVKVEFYIGVLAPSQLLIVLISGKENEQTSPTDPQQQAHSSRLDSLTAGSTRQLVDYYQLDTTAAPEITVWLGKTLPATAPAFSPESLVPLRDELEKQTPEDIYELVRQQDEELLNTHEDLHKRQEELQELHLELADTNRGVVALYAELDEREYFAPGGSFHGGSCPSVEDYF